MVFTLVLLVMAAVVINMRRRMTLLEARVEQLEDRPQRMAPFAADVRPAAVSPAAPPEPATVPVPVTQPEPLPEPAPEPVAKPMLLRVGRPVAAAPVEIAADVPDDAEPARAFSFEDLFGRRLPIWAGGITLAVAGVLIVKYSIDAGLLSPLVRVLFGLLFGGGLIGAAEFALRREDKVRDPRVRQALSGAGLATLYASILIAANLYALIGPLNAFVGLAAVTALAMVLSVRFGAPSAVLGLVGGLATPALVGTGDPNVPLLSCYLALAVGGLCALSRRQRWMWLGVSALVGGMGWGAILILGGVLDFASSLSIGLLVLAMGIGLPLLAFGAAGGAIIRVLAAVGAAAQMAALVAMGGFAMLHWGLFGLLSVALVWLAMREPAFGRLPAVGLLVALLLAGVWPDPEAVSFALVLGAAAIIYGAPALWRLWREQGGLLEAAQIAMLGLGGTAVSMLQFYRADEGMDGGFALLALAAAGLPAAGLITGWNSPARQGDARFPLLATAGAVLLMLAGGLAFPEWLLPVTIAAICAGLLTLSIAARDPHVERSGWAFLLLAIVILVVGENSGRELARLVEHTPMIGIEAVVRWASVALAAGFYGWRGAFRAGRVAAEAATALLAYGTLAQVIPADWLAVTAAAIVVLVVELGLRVRRTLPMATAAATAVVLLWAAMPVLEWLMQAVLSLTGTAVRARALPEPGEAIRQLLLPAALLGFALWRLESLPAFVRRGATIGIGVMAAVAAHILFKQIFDLRTASDVEAFALAERCVWQALLVGLGAALWRLGRWPRVASALVAAGLGHALLYNAVLLNPLWAEQAVGGWPLVNLVVPAFGLPAAALWLLTRMEPDIMARLARPVEIVRMLLVALFAFATLRQLFHGTLLTEAGLTAMEDILRSGLAIGLAGGFLLWGIRRQNRDWRIASLVLMVAAVGKVFLFDASGLDGLLRIASFIALGFSLIGIGWLYSR